MMKVSAALVGGFLVADAAGVDAAANLADSVWSLYNSIPTEYLVAANLASAAALEIFDASNKSAAAAPAAAGPDADAAAVAAAANDGAGTRGARRRTAAAVTKDAAAE